MGANTHPLVQIQTAQATTAVESAARCLPGSARPSPCYWASQASGVRVVRSDGFRGDAVPSLRGAPRTREAGGEKRRRATRRGPFEDSARVSLDPRGDPASNETARVPEARGSSEMFAPTGLGPKPAGNCYRPRALVSRGFRAATSPQGSPRSPDSSSTLAPVFPHQPPPASTSTPTSSDLAL